MKQTPSPDTLPFLGTLVAIALGFYFFNLWRNWTISKKWEKENTVLPKDQLDRP